MRCDGKETPPHAALFHNNHDGTFTEVAAKAGVTNDRWGVGVAIADYDNDGWPDIYVTNWGKNRLITTITMGLLLIWPRKPECSWVTGRLARRGEITTGTAASIYLCLATFTSIATICLPAERTVFPIPSVPFGSAGELRTERAEGEPDHLFHNNGDGTFTDVSEKAGVADTPGYYGLSSLFVDINNDGKPDLLVADDSTPNYLYLNKATGHLRMRVMHPATH